jgi:hypothetical protein
MVGSQEPVPLAMLRKLVPILAVLALFPLAVAGATPSMTIPRSVRIGHRVTVWVSGRTATDIASNYGPSLEIQPTASRGGNGIGVAPKFHAFTIGTRAEVIFVWPWFDNMCFASRDLAGRECVHTPWRIGGQVDVSVCAQGPEYIIDSCARGTTIVRR